MFLGDSRGLFLQPRFATNWTLIRSQSATEVFAPLARFRLLILLVTGLSFLLVLLFSQVQIRRSLVPLEQLRDATVAIREGRADIRVSIGNRDEFAEVGLSFNQMAQGLEEYLHGTSALQRISRDLSAAAGPAELHRRVVCGARELVHAAGSQLFLIAPGGVLVCCGEEFEGLGYAVPDAPAAFGEPPLFATGEPLSAGPDVVRVAANGGESVSLPATGGHTHHTVEACCDGEAHLERVAGGVLAVPLREADGRVLGVLHLLAPAGVEFPAGARRLVEALAAQAGSALVRSQLTAELRDRERLYRGLVEDSPAAICIHDREGTLRYVNPAWAQELGWEPEELLGRPLGGLLDVQDQPRDREYLEGIGTSAAYQGVFRLRTRGGDRRTWSYRGIGQVTDEGEFRVIGHAQDLTEQRELEANLAHAEKLQAVGTLAGGIAHDFNNVLTPILIGAELALAEVPAEGRVARNLERILAAGGRAKGLVAQILTFSRRRDGGRSVVALHMVVGEVVKLLRSTLPAAIEIEEDIGRSADVVVADVGQMHQVMMNLCTNARHAMKAAGGVLRVELAPVEIDRDTPGPAGLEKGSYVRLAITDSGTGMEAAVRDRVFDPFFTTKGEGEGTGMGLSIVHGIVADHGGTIRVDSAPGQGSRFEVWLPRVDALAEEVSDSAVAPVPGRGEAVLFLDDREEVAEVAEAMLASLHYTPVVFRDATRALASFAAAPDRFDVVFCDQDMPVMTGLEFTRRVREIRPGIPVVLCTGLPTPELEARAAAAGIAELCCKPLGTAAVARALRHALALSAPAVSA